MSKWNFNRKLVRIQTDGRIFNLSTLLSSSFQKGQKVSFLSCSISQDKRKVGIRGTGPSPHSGKWVPHCGNQVSQFRTRCPIRETRVKNGNYANLSSLTICPRVDINPAAVDKSEDVGLSPRVIIFNFNRLNLTFTFNI